MRWSNNLVIITGLSCGLGLTACSNSDRVAANQQPVGQNQTASDTTARDNGYADRAATANLSASDRTFAMKAAQGGMAEVELGKLAQEKGATSQVKDFGQKLINDHSKLNDKLKNIASREGITLPSEVSVSQRQLIANLSKLSGSRFDRDFMKHAVSDHREDISDFKKEANNGQDAAMKDFASSAIPTLEDHLHAAQGHGGMAHQ